jgi:hypothetical protein
MIDLHLSISIPELVDYRLYVKVRRKGRRKEFRVPKIAESASRNAQWTDDGDAAMARTCWHQSGGNAP